MEVIASRLEEVEIYKNTLVVALLRFPESTLSTEPKSE